MMKPTLQLLAKVAAGILLLIVVRSLGEVFRLEGLRGGALTIAEIRPFIIGALVAALALALALTAILARRPRATIVIGVLTVAGLFVYRVFYIG
jgi:hypothetical protein